MSEQEGLNEQQRQLISRFINTYNAIDHTLRDRLGVKQQSFVKSVEQYAQRHPQWKDEETLKIFAQLRNFIVHSTTPRDHQLAVPVLNVVEKIEAIHTRMSRTVGEQFSREVMTLTTNHSLVDVLQLIREKSFSQFPVFEEEEYAGLLTENGISRWLASHLSSTLDYQDIAATTAEQVLEEEEKRESYAFVRPETPVDDIVVAFGANPGLEAVLITESGKSSIRLLGIVTPWDIIVLSD